MQAEQRGESAPLYQQWIMAHQRRRHALRGAPGRSSHFCVSSTPGAATVNVRTQEANSNLNFHVSNTLGVTRRTMEALQMCLLRHRRRRCVFFAASSTPGVTLSVESRAGMEGRKRGGAGRGGGRGGAGRHPSLLRELCHSCADIIWGGRYVTCRCCVNCATAVLISSGGDGTSPVAAA